MLKKGNLPEKPQSS